MRTTAICVVLDRIAVRVEHSSRDGAPVKDRHGHIVQHLAVAEHERAAAGTEGAPLVGMARLHEGGFLDDQRHRSGGQVRKGEGASGIGRDGRLSNRRALDRDTRARHGGAGRAVHDPPSDDRGSDTQGGNPIASRLDLIPGRDTRYHALRCCGGRLDQHQRGCESDLTSLRAHHDAPFADDKY